MPKTEIASLDYSVLEGEAVLKELKSSIAGLSEAETRRRLRQYGENKLAKKRDRSIVAEYFSYFKSPLIIILLIATGVSVFFGEVIDASIIGVMIFLSVTLDFFEEHTANQAAKKLSESIKTTSTVIRGNQKKEIKTAEICLGDIIFISAGDLVPADARIIWADDFFVNQSALTGESFPSEKSVAVRQKADDVSLSGQHNIVFFGTNVVSGSAKAVVIRTGITTEFGKIAEHLAEREVKSEFEIGVTKFGYLIMKVIIFLVLFIFLFNSLLKHDILESMMFALAIAVGVTPELLPMIMSITMARGSLKMAKKGVIVKRLAAIPNFGGMDILCTDKTGTLTEDHISLVNYVDISGADSPDALKYAYINSSFETGIKNPLDRAILDFKKVSIRGYKKIDEIPFDFFRKMMSVVADGPEGYIMIVKGAPEEIFKHVKTYRLGDKVLPFHKEAQAEAINYYHKISADGFRVLAVAVKKPAEQRAVYSKEDESELELLGFVSFLDPPKKGIKNILEKFHQEGVRVKVLTGDNEFVAQKICQEVGLEVRGVLLGSEIAKLTDDALGVKAESTTIFARFSPEEKSRIISALRALGHVVGYLGDGINDAPSLKNADVGISVSNAVDIAKESADIILTTKSLKSLEDGIIEGRAAFGNTMKYILMGLSSNFGNMFSMAGAILFLPFLPMLPLQILLNNFLYDFSQITIPTDKVDSDWTAQPRRWNINFIKKFMYVFGPVSSFYDFLTFFVLFFLFQSTAPVFQTGWFIESLATQTLVIYVIRTRHLPFIQSSPSKYLLLSTLLIVGIGWILPYTAIGAFFKFTPLPPVIMITIVGIVLAYLITVEIIKRFFYRTDGFDFAAIKTMVKRRK